MDRFFIFFADKLFTKKKILQDSRRAILAPENTGPNHNLKEERKNLEPQERCLTPGKSQMCPLTSRMQNTGQSVRQYFRLSMYAS